MPAKRQHISPGQPERTKTGFSELDEITGGFAPGELIIVASRPAMGRTSLLFNLAMHIALIEKKGIAVLSPTSKAENIIPMLLSMQANFEWHKVCDGSATSDDWQSLQRAGQAIGEANIKIRNYFYHNMNCFVYDLRHCNKNVPGISIYGFSNLSKPFPSPWKEDECLQLKDAVRNMPTPMIISLPLWIEDHSPADNDEPTSYTPTMRSLRKWAPLAALADTVLLLHYEDAYHYGETNYKSTGHHTITVIKQGRERIGVVPVSFSTGR